MEKGNPSALLVGMQTAAATMENSMEFPQKLKMELPFDPMIPLLGIYPKDPKTPTHKNLCTPMVIAAIITTTKCWKQPKCPLVNEWFKKLLYLDTMEYYTAERRNSYLLQWMDLEHYAK